MRSAVLLFTILILVSRQTVNGVDYDDAIRNPNVAHALKTLCENPSDSIRKAVECFKENDGRWRLSPGDNAIALFVDVTPQEMKVVELTRKPDGQLVEEQVKGTDKGKLEVVIKVEFNTILPKERFYAKLLADKKIGPKVYKIPVHDHSVPFEEYLILERINGLTLDEWISLWTKAMSTRRARTDKAYSLTLVINWLSMEIVYLRRVMDIWKFRHRFCDAHTGNFIMESVPMEMCQQREERKEKRGVSFDVIGEGKNAKCLIWRKKYSFLLDAAAMVPLTDPLVSNCGWDYENNGPVYVDLYRVFEAWFSHKDWMKSRLEGVSQLANQMDEVIGTIEEGMPPAEEDKRGPEILKRLIELRDSVGKPLKAPEADRHYDTSLKLLRSRKRTRNVDMRAKKRARVA